MSFSFSGSAKKPDAKGFSSSKGFSFKPLASSFEIPLGTSDEGPFGLHSRDREHHTHIIGSTGTGKSKFLELLIRHDIEQPGTGLCLLDPHGSLYEDVLHYIAHERPDLADRVILFNPAQETEHIIGFNPVITDGDKLDYLLDSLIAACLKAWGQDNSDRTPRITKWLENIFYTIICNDLTLVEAAPLMSIQSKAHREVLLRNVHNDMVLDDWRMFDSSSNTQKQALIEGAANRLRKFLRNEQVRNIIGQKERVLDISRVMDEGKILLINLNGQGVISNENSKLLGVLLVNEIFRCAKLRNPRDPSLKPFYFYIDEFAQFITRDIAYALEEARKFKLRMVLAHQHLAQLRDEDEYLYASVLTNCKNKIVFGGLSREDATIMAEEVSSGFISMSAVKDEIYSTKTRQHLEKRTVDNWSEGQNQSATKGNSTGDTSGSSNTRNEARSSSQTEGRGNTDGVQTPAHGSEAFSSGRTKSVSYGQSSQSGTAQSNSQSRTKSTTHSDTTGTSTSKGTSETWVSVSEDYQELSSRTFWSLQELEYMKMAQLKNQGVAQAYVKLWDQEPKTVQINKVEAAPFTPDSEALIEQARGRAIAANSAYYTALPELETERHARQVAAFGEPLRFTMQEPLTVEGANSSPVIDADDPFN